MPYYIEKDNEACKSGWAVTGDTGVVHGCHTTKASAIKQAVAISISTDEPFAGERAAVDSLEKGDYVSWDVLDPEVLGEIEMVDGQMAVVCVYEVEDGIFSSTDKYMIMNVFKLEKVPAPEMLAEEFELVDTTDVAPMPTMLDRAKALIARIEPKNESESMTEPVLGEARDKWVRAAWKIKSRLEGTEGRSLGGIETRANHVELRAEGDGRTFSGYASVFNEPSLPLPFTEIVKPGAFKRSLQSRNRMMLLWNHDTSNPLASTRNGSLVLTEDSKGLFVTATLPNTTLGNDIAELVRSGVVDEMSFGFSVRKDSWSQDGNTRYLEDVSLSEVSLVSTPAYEQTSGTVSVRSEVRNIDADQLANAMAKLESGEELGAEDALLLTDIVNKLSKAEEVTEVKEVEGDITALYKAKLALAEMGN
jgi:HK97 family phage prohead protease